MADLLLVYQPTMTKEEQTYFQIAKETMHDATKPSLTSSSSSSEMDVAESVGQVYTATVSAISDALSVVRDKVGQGLVYVGDSFVHAGDALSPVSPPSAHMRPHAV
eukprot:TRINITY_DN13551_c0_g1_i1.p1 TRINITY_DN13551_c0_g1~~TRINITY_DN13551_c0_g1_i1.p1  ORF type:complete len:106 (-),score=19.05 TRINITY_DN13551_c0_g1_i1:31-348(-)